MTLSTLLILAVCRTLIIYELRNVLCTPESLCGSVVEHRSAEFERFWYDSSWGLRILSFSYLSFYELTGHLKLF